MNKFLTTLLTLFLFQTNLFSHECHRECCKWNPPFRDYEASFSDYYKKLKYETSLAYTKYNSNGMWWSHIAPFKLYLGALPLKNEGHLEQIQALGVTRVLSLVENFEVEDGWINSPVKKEDWEAKGIEVLHIEAEDFLPLKQEEIELGVEYLARMLEQGETVYVHCKAGRGRSATIVIVYLMKNHHLTFDEAYHYVHECRPHINLNVQQRAAIFHYFGMEPPIEMSYWEAISQSLNSFFCGVNEMSEEKLAYLIQNTLSYAINGVNSKDLIPESMSTWIPFEIESTLQRRNRYLQEFEGNQNAAVHAAIERNKGMSRKFKVVAAGFIPLVGAPTSYSISLWHQMREITLIAALYGHDINDPDVQLKILSCLVGGNTLKLPAYSVDIVARHIVKKIAAGAGLNRLVGSIVVPTHLIFNYFTENSAHVSEHAIMMFGYNNALHISPDQYWIFENFEKK